MTKRALQARWDATSEARVLAALRAGTAPDIFGQTEQGRWDLRGFCLSQILRGVRCSKLDLSYSSERLAGQWQECHLEDVVFDHGALTTNFRGKFTDCGFRKTNMNRVNLGGTFERCDFTGAKLAHSGTAGGTLFRECLFTDADLRGAHWTACHFLDCQWSGVKFGRGSFYRSQFTGAAPTSLADTLMDHVSFQ